MLIRSSFDPIFFKTTIQSVEDKVNPVNLTNPIVYSMQYKDTRKSNPFHGFLNGLTPVCLQCVPALNISPLKNFTAFQLNDLHYYLYAGG